MRPIPASFSRLRPARWGAILVLVALLVQGLLPSAAVFALADPLRGAPICAADAHQDGGRGGAHKAAHRACPLCQAPSVAWGFLPSTESPILSLRLSVRVVWHPETIGAAAVTVARARARGPPAAA